MTLRCSACNKVVASKNDLTVKNICFDCHNTSAYFPLSYGYDVMDKFGVYMPMGTGVTNNTLLMGIELEYEQSSGVSFNRHSKRHLAYAGYKTQYGIVKNDGSLDNGAEFVTRPTTLRCHRKFMDKFMDLQPLNGMHTTRNCGMHVHLSKDSFTATHLAKFLVFFGVDDNYHLLKKVAGRNYMSNTYCNNDSDFKPKMGDIDSEKNVNFYAGFYMNKYSPVNVKDNTVEVRIFSSSKNKNKIMARLEFCEALFRFTKHASVDNLTAENFLNWVCARSKKYNNMVEYLVSRGVVINLATEKVET